jgi:hypothetical protein
MYDKSVFKKEDINCVSKGSYMAEEFLSDGGLVETVGERCDREPIRIVLIGSRPAITSTIYRLHILDFAKANEWSRLQPTPNGKLMSVCSKYITL